MSIEDLFDLQTPLGYAQMLVQEIDMYRSYKEAAAYTIVP